MRLCRCNWYALLFSPPPFANTTLTRLVNLAAQPNTTTGPNGALSWLNCGLSTSSPKSGWTPPLMRLSDLIVKTSSKNITDLVKEKGSPYGHCEEFAEIFEEEGRKEGVPGLMLAAFALQESGCQSAAVGSGGTAGLLQLSPVSLGFRQSFATMTCSP